MSFQPGQKVTLTGLSRAELNGQTGTVSSFDAAKGRFNVILVGGQTMAIKPANLQAAAAGAGGGMFGGAGAAGGPQMAQAQAQAEQMLRKLQAELGKYVPEGMSIQSVLVIFAVLAVAAWMILGFLRAVLLVALVVATLRLGLPAYQAGGGGRAGATAAVKAMGQAVSGRLQSASGGKVSLSWWQGLLLATVVFLVLWQPFGPATAGVAGGGGGGGGGAADMPPGMDESYMGSGGDDDAVEDDDDDLDIDDYTGGGSSSGGGGGSLSAAVRDSMAELVDKAYQAGWDDAGSDETLDFGASKKAVMQEIEGMAAAAVAGAAEEGSSSGSSGGRRRKPRRTSSNFGSSSGSPPPMPPPRARGGGGMNMFSFIPIVFIGKQLYDLGAVPGQGFNFQLMVTRVQDPNVMPRWRLAILGFFVLRTFGLSPF